MSENIGAVFIYGAGFSNFIWQDVKPLIKYPALYIEFPNREEGEKDNYGLSLDDYLASAMSQIEKWDKDKIVFITHSIGGCLGLKLADFYKENIAGFVGIGSAIPVSGKSFVSCQSFPQNFLMPILLRLFGTKPPQKVIEREVCNDLTSNQTSEVVTRFTPEAKDLYTTKLEYDYLEPNSLYIKLLEDQGFPARLQDEMVLNLKAKRVITMKSGHLPMLSQSKELSKILNKFLANTIKNTL